MKKILLLATLFIFATILYAEDIPVVNAPTGQLQLFPDYPKGMNTKQATHLIQNDEFQDCGDVLFDKEFGGVVRGGYLQSNTSILSTATIRYMHEYPKVNGNKYMLVCSSNVLAYSANGIAYTTLLTTVTTNSKMWAVNYNDICYLGFNSWNRWKFDGTTLMASTNTPQIRYGTVYMDKIVGINVNETGGKSKLVYSDVGYPEIWPALNYIYIDRDDGDELTGIKVYRGNLYAFKRYSGIYQMIGLEDGYPTNDGYNKIISGIGCLYGETIQEKDGLLYFISARGLESFDGINVKPVPISDRINSDIKNLTQMYSSVLVHGETVADDFADGTMVNCDTSTVANSLSLTISSITTLDSTGDVGQWSSLAIDSSNNPYIVYYDTTNFNLKFTSWTSAGWVTSVVDATGDVGSYCSLALDSNNIPCISYYDATNYNLKYASWTSVGWSSSTIDSTGDVGQWTSIAIDTTTNNAHISYYDVTNSELKYSSHTTAGWVTSTISLVGGTADIGKYTSIKLDTNREPHISYHRNQFTTWQLRYSSHTSAGWVHSVVDGSGQIGYYTSLSLDKNNKPYISYRDNGGGYLWCAKYTSSAWALTRVGSVGMGLYSSIALDNNNIPYISYSDNTGTYLKLAYWGNYLWVSDGWTITTIDNYTGYSSLVIDNNNKKHISYYDTTNGNLKYYGQLPGYYTSGKFNGTTSDYSWLGWQNFKATENLGTGITVNYYTRTATSENGLDTANWQQINNNSYSKSNDGSWLQYKFEFIPTTEPTTASRIDDVSIDYGVDSQNKPLVSAVLDRRYFLAGAIKPAINNNVIYVLDQNNNWTKFNNMYVGSFCNFKNDLYFGSSTDTFQINKYSEDFTTDNGVAIHPYIKTKDYDFGSRFQDKTFSDLWIYAEPSIVFSTMTVSFYINKLTTAEATESISLVANSIYPDRPIVSKIRNDADRWRYINFYISDFDKFYGINFFYGLQNPE